MTEKQINITIAVVGPGKDVDIEALAASIQNALRPDEPEVVREMRTMVRALKEELPELSDVHVADIVGPWLCVVNR